MWSRGKEVGVGGEGVDNCRVASIYNNNSATVTGKSPTRPITLAWVAALAQSVRYWRSGTGTSPEPCHPPVPRCALSAARWTKRKGECPAIRRDSMPKDHDALWSRDIQLQCDVASHQDMSCSTLYHMIMSCSTLYHMIMSCSTLYHMIMSCSTLYHMIMSCSTLYHMIMHWLMEKVGEQGWEQGISLQAPVPDLPSWITPHLQIIHCLQLGQRFC